MVSKVRRLSVCVEIIMRLVYSGVRLTGESLRNDGTRGIHVYICIIWSGPKAFRGGPYGTIAYHFQRKRRTLGCCRRPRLSSGRFHRGDRGRHPKAQEEPKAQAKAVRHGGGGGGGTDDDGDGDGLPNVEVVVVVRMGAIRILRPLVCGVGEGTTQMLCCCWETAKGFGSRDICTTQTGAYVCSV